MINIREDTYGKVPKSEIFLFKSCSSVADKNFRGQPACSRVQWFADSFWPSTWKSFFFSSYLAVDPCKIFLNWISTQSEYRNDWQWAAFFSFYLIPHVFQEKGVVTVRMCFSCRNRRQNSQLSVLIEHLNSISIENNLWCYKPIGSRTGMKASLTAKWAFRAWCPLWICIHHGN